MTNQTRPQNPARRRLARGALATPVVFASLTAKNALAGKYHCSTSGKMSGNMSRTTDKDCRSIGDSCDTWKERHKTSTRKVVDCLGVEYKGKTETLYNFKQRKRATSNCADKGWTSATCEHIFWGEDYSAYRIADVQLVWAGLCAYLNAEKFGREYHISTADARGLFQGALGVSVFQKNGKNWTAAECRNHLQALYF